jgi:hypothetical protein
MFYPGSQIRPLLNPGSGHPDPWGKKAPDPTYFCINPYKQILFAYPGSRIREVKKHRIPDPTYFCIKAINKFCLLILDPGSGSDHCSIPDPGSGGKKAPDPGSGSATLIKQGNILPCKISRKKLFYYTNLRRISSPTQILINSK